MGPGLLMVAGLQLGGQNHYASLPLAARLVLAYVRDCNTRANMQKKSPLMGFLVGGTGLEPATSSL